MQQMEEKKDSQINYLQTNDLISNLQNEVKHLANKNEECQRDILFLQSELEKRNSSLS